MPGHPCPIRPWPKRAPAPPPNPCHSNFSSHHTLPLSEFQRPWLHQRYHYSLAFTLFLEGSSYCPIPIRFSKKKRKTVMHQALLIFQISVTIFLLQCSLSQHLPAPSSLGRVFLLHIIIALCPSPSLSLVVTINLRVRDRLVL